MDIVLVSLAFVVAALCKPHPRDRHVHGALQEFEKW